ncbi:unnamed protein product [Chilo suppressalis]|uniref:Uncharacterized protein n=1 Tax=Chilo suppressalis TaxID=168631 RepID=A0ABN8L5H8_CHISP|nr:unnamed protein product [Chilo suppressalis]
MSKVASVKAAAVDASRFCKSTFSLTFAVELLGIDVWHDCNEGWIDLGPCVQGMRIQYQLYPGQVYDLDILIWPHVAKIWCGAHYGWVRTWQFLERRFLTFSIRHIFPVRVMELQSFIATITPLFGIANLSTNAKNDKNVEVYLPSMKFGDQRYFAPVVEREQTLIEYLVELIWSLVEKYIPASTIDGVFDVPKPVTDVRHQDTIMYYVKEAILNKFEKETEPELELEPEEFKIKERRETKIGKDKEKEKEKKRVEVPKVKFEIKLLGDSILAGVGRIVPFENIGDRPNDLGEFITIISSTNLPAQDDRPIIFVNVDTLTNLPAEYLRKLRISQVYTRWVINKETHNSQPQNINIHKSDIKFNDHHALHFDPDAISKVTATLLDNPFEVQLRGIRSTNFQKDMARFFGYKKGDQSFGVSSSKFENEDLDVLIAVTKIDTHDMAKGMSNFIRGEYSLFPPRTSLVELEREPICSNDINHIKQPIYPNTIVPAHVILETQMSLEVSMGLVGCKAKKLTESFARLYCLVKDTEIIMTILKSITEINEGFLQCDMEDNVLTGFALDVGDVVLLYVEGPSNGQILKIWEMTEDFYPTIRPVFSSSNRYSSRIYPGVYIFFRITPSCIVLISQYILMLFFSVLSKSPFNVLKMYVPLSVILACPPVYVRPALPFPTRSVSLNVTKL